MVEAGTTSNRIVDAMVAIATLTTTARTEARRRNATHSSPTASATRAPRDKVAAIAARRTSVIGMRTRLRLRNLGGAKRRKGSADTRTYARSFESGKGPTARG